MKATFVIEVDNISVGAIPQLQRYLERQVELISWPGGPSGSVRRCERAAYKLAEMCSGADMANQTQGACLAPGQSLEEFCDLYGRFA